MNLIMNESQYPVQRWWKERDWRRKKDWKDFYQVLFSHFSFLSLPFSDWQVLHQLPVCLESGILDCRSRYLNSTAPFSWQSVKSLGNLSLGSVPSCVQNSTRTYRSHELTLLPLNSWCGRGRSASWGSSGEKPRRSQLDRNKSAKLLLLHDSSL